MKTNRKTIFIICISCAVIYTAGLQLVSGLKAPFTPASASDEQVRWISHRGHSSAPENTLSAFRLAEKKGFRYVECDVRFTSDMIPVLIHDSSVTRTSDGSGLVGEYTFNRLQKFDFGRRKASRFKGERIPSFDSFLELCARLGLHPYIDLKELDEKKALILYEITAKHGMVYNVSWLGPPETLMLIRNVIPTARLGIIVKQSDPLEIGRAVDMLKTAANTVFLDIQYKLVDVSLANWCREKGVELEAWGVRNMSEARSLIAMGVTGITGDIAPPQSARTSAGVRFDKIILE
ncbi:MAG: glycerophosphodiester phosphodiesterase [Eubacteriales bacterium]